MLLHCSLYIFSQSQNWRIHFHKKNSNRKDFFHRLIRISLWKKILLYAMTISNFSEYIYFVSRKKCNWVRGKSVARCHRHSRLLEQTGRRETNISHCFCSSVEKYAELMHCWRGGGSSSYEWLLITLVSHLLPASVL